MKKLNLKKININEKQIEVKIQNKRIKIKADINQMLLN